MAALFEIRNLSVAVFDQDAAHAGADHGLADAVTGRPLGPGWVPAIDGASLIVRRGEVVTLAGESGHGKTLIVMAALGLLAPSARVTGGEVFMNGERFDAARFAPEHRSGRKKRFGSQRWLAELDDPLYARIMGRDIGIVFQDPISSWDPIPLIGEQAGEVLEEHSELTLEGIERRVHDLLGEVKLPQARKFFSFAHELSRGEAQRAMLAAALMNGPSLLVADEPFTGLDPPVAQGIVELIRDMRLARGLAMIMVNHDLAQVASLADRVGIVYGGRIVELAPVGDVYRRPRHPYTEGLLGSIPWQGVDRLHPIPGEKPRLIDVPRNECGFAPRCEYAIDACRTASPEVRRVDGAQVACMRADELTLRGVG